MSWQMIQFQNVTDGLSSSILAGDRAIRPENGQAGKVYFGSWFQAGFLFTVATTMQSPNYFNGMKYDAPGFKLAYTFIPNNLNSYHPGGVNALFCDGSVRFVKSSVQSWPVDPTSYWPVGSTQDNTLYFYTNLPKTGVWQALSTRSGGEVISGGDY